MKKGAVLINIARGALINSEALKRGLDRDQPRSGGARRVRAGAAAGGRLDVEASEGARQRAHLAGTAPARCAAATSCSLRT